MKVVNHKNVMIGDILNEFFLPSSITDEKIWLMYENSLYTQIVRKWTPVIDAVTEAKSSLITDCAKWQVYNTDSHWKPGAGDSFNEFKSRADQGKAYRKLVESPLGTEPETCKEAAMPYFTSVISTLMSVNDPYRIITTPLIPIQTDKLHTCAIGSFNLFATVDRIDCQRKNAVLNFWIYNAMTRGSFGRYATHPKFKHSGMKTQYMWWNWIESFEWKADATKTS
jgi:hypothetical protein